MNLRDIRDADKLEIFERLLSTIRAETLPSGIPITPAGYRAIHRYMLQDVYEWAGQDRYVDTGRTGPFFKAEYVDASMNKQFAALHAENDLRGLSAADFAERAAEHVGELNAIHPFLDGNGRTLRAFLERLGEQAGHTIDLARIDPAAWNRASVVSFHHFDNRMMAEIIAGTIVASERHQDPEAARLEYLEHCREFAASREPTQEIEPPEQSLDDDFER